MRVVAGSAKGRQLKTPPPDSGTRPILDRVKTALFDTLAGDVMDATFLDLFAGTGAIGIEALSRGAKAATFIELSQEIAALVRENLALTRLADHATVTRSDAFTYLAYAHRHGATFDIVYVAPPQYQGMAARAFTQLDTAPVTIPGSLVIAQIDPKERGELATLALRNLRLYDERRYGNTLLRFYEHIGEQDQAPESEPPQEPAGE
ncbi:MAG: 16S rRNA (guanine(966)-N(2))-methyltransferase RsmD [Ktedonobacterales bacterium]